MNVQALVPIKKHNFYPEYVWQPGDFENHETWVWAAFQALAEGLAGSAVLGGLEANVAGGLNIQIEAGVACNRSGRPVIHKTSAQVAVAADGSNPRRNLIVLRPKEVSGDNIPDPLNPMTQVPLTENQTYDLLSLPGTPAVSPSYPTPQDNDIVLCGVYIAAAAVSIAQTDLDFGQTHRVRPHRSRYRKETANYSVAETDEIIEVDATAGNRVCTLPPAASTPHQTFTFIKVDSSANTMAVSANGGETISGVSVIDTDTQWDTIRVVSNGINAYRQI